MPGHRLALIHPPADFARTLGALPDGVVMVGDDAAPLDLAVVFTTARTSCRPRFRGRGNA